MTQLRSKCILVPVAIFLAACGSTSSDPAGGGAGGQAGAGGVAASGGSSGSGASGGGGAAATGGSGGSVDCEARCGSPGCPACAGPSMIAAQTLEGDPYRIDTTEVTNAQYAEFLAAGVDPGGQSADCAWNTDFHPTVDAVTGCTGDLYDAANRAEYPVVCVDWCDAAAYCKWVGKRWSWGFGQTSSADPARLPIPSIRRVGASRGASSTALHCAARKLTAPSKHWDASAVLSICPVRRCFMRS